MPNADLDSQGWVYIYTKYDYNRMVLNSVFSRKFSQVLACDLDSQGWVYIYTKYDYNRMVLNSVSRKFSQVLA